MKTISKPLQNMGGLLKLWAIPAGNYGAALRTGKTVTFHDPAIICSIYCSQDSMKLDEVPDTSAQAGLVYDTEITGFVPGDTEYAREQFSLMADGDFIVICVDANENYRIAGDFLTPLQFSSRFTTGSSSADRAGHEISFSGKTFEKAMPINNPF